MTRMMAGTKRKARKVALPLVYGADGGKTASELFIYFGSLGRMCVEAEMSSDPRVHRLALRVIARQSEKIRDLLIGVGADGADIEVGEHLYLTRSTLFQTV
jgi:hypothetical protein